MARRVAAVVGMVWRQNSDSLHPRPLPTASEVDAIGLDYRFKDTLENEQLYVCLP